MEDNNYTLEQMRADYQALKDTLAKQDIVNDRLLREAMRGKISSIRNKAAFSVVCGMFVMLSAPFVFHFNPVVNASWYFVIATELLMAFCIFMDWKFNHKVQTTDLMSCDLLTFSKDVKKLKEDYQGWLKWGFIFGFCWIGWLMTEVWLNTAEHKMALPMIIGLLVGFFAGMVFGLRIQNRIISTCDEIIDNIEN